MKNSICSLRTLRSLLFICVVAALIVPLVSLQKSDARLLETEAAISPAQPSKELLNAAAAPMMMPQPFLPPCTIQPGLIISEFRLRGAAGANDEFIELYNSTDSAITVCTTDGSSGWAVAARNAAATSATTLFVIPIFTVIPPRGHYLGVNNAVNGYSLGSYPSGVGTTATGDATYSIGVDDNAGIALFNTATEANFNTSTRLDAIGFSGPTGAIADLYREGTGFPQIGTANGQYTLVRRLSGGFPGDGNDNLSDIWFLSTTAGTFGGSVASSLGAPGPENLGSPVVRNSVLPVLMLDSTVATSVAPNRGRDLTSDPANNSNFGTLAMRRRIVNNSGAPVTRLRFHVTNITTFPPPNGTTADLRVRSAPAATVTNVNDPATCAAHGTPSTPPCTVTVQGTTVEEPPTQSMGGGFNSTVTIALPQPLAAGASVVLQFLMGVQQSGGFTFLLNCVALPASNPPAAPSGLTAAAESTSAINLSWTDNSNDETSFRVERKTGAAGTWAEVGSVGPNTTVYSSGGLLANTQYYYRVRATNSSGNSAYSAEANATTANLLPSVTLTAPTAGQIFNAPANISLTANASDPDGTISKVQFFQGTTLLNEDTTAPYSFSWNNVAAGSYSLTAKAFDNLGATTTSAAVAIVVNALPTVSITSPTHPTTIAAPATFTINASASDPDGTITKVQFFAGVSFLGEDTTAPYSLPMNNLGQGVYSLTAKAIDNRGAITTSSLVSVVVNALPSVSITSPTPPVTLIAPATWTIQATASDPDGSIVKVEFFAGAGLLGTDTTAPYSWPMNNMARGVYSLTAVATDNLGGTKTSNLVPVVVTDAPATNITAPFNNSGFMAGVNINIQANASDDNSVNKVEFFQNGVLLGSDDFPPYSFVWNNIPAGTYALTSKATDNTNITTTSAPVNITVLSPNGISRLDPMNRIGGGSEDPLSRNYNWSVPILSLPGRAGLDLGLTLSYNSLVWTRSGNFITFDDDKGWPGPGFRLGLPVIQAQYFNPEVGKNAFLLIAPDGSRVELRQVGSSALYETGDSSHLLLDSNTMILRSTDGTQLKYVWKGSDFQCTEIKDRNGNYITVNYTSFGRIDTIIDTLGRTIKFNYNPDNTLGNISQTWAGQSHVWAWFSYWDVQFRTNFVNVTKVGATNLSQFKALRSVQLNDGTAHVFDYNTWGQVHRITNYAADQHVLNYRAYDLPLDDSVALDDCPRFTERHDWAENVNRTGPDGPAQLPAGAEQEIVTRFEAPVTASWTLPDNTQQSGIRAKVIFPDNTYTQIYMEGTAGTPNGWRRFLPSLVEIYDAANVRQKQTVTTWIQDNTGVSYQLNPRVLDRSVYDAAGNRARTSFTYQTVNLSDGTTCHLPQEISEHQTNGAVLRRRHTDYELNSVYTSRRIIGLVAASYLYDGNNALMSKITFSYDWDWSGDMFQDVPGGVQVTNHDRTNYGPGFIVGRGNLSQRARYDVNDPNNVNNTWQETKWRVNLTGSVLMQRDHQWHQSFIAYNDSFSDGINRNTFAYPTTLTDEDGHSSTIKYNFDFGSVTRTQGAAPAEQSVGTIKHFSYDSSARVQKVAMEFNGNPDHSHVRFEYPSSGTRVDTYRTAAEGVGETHSFRIFDGYGRSFASAADHPGSTGGSSGQLVLYDVMGRVVKESNPAETSANGEPQNWVTAGDDASTSWLYTHQTYDWQGRPRLTTNTDGTTKEASYLGCGCAGGEVITLTDEGTLENGVPKRRQQKIYSDVLGRRIKTELLNWVDGSVFSATVNTYNVRDQLERVRVFGGPEGSATFQDTTMTYDGRGRLKTRHIPEQDASAVTTYDYKSDDTVERITDGRGATQTFTYNGRHLITGIVYGVPAGSNIPDPADVTVTYDPAGNRTFMSDDGGSVTYHYNQLSQMTSESRIFSGLGGSYQLSYQYNFMGEVKKVTDWTNATINYNYDTAGRTLSVTGENTLYGGVSQYASGMTYRAWGGTKGLTYGNNFSRTISYNDRLQVSQFEVKNSAAAPIMQTQFQYFPDATLKYAKNLLDERFDRAFSYDHLGMFKEIYTGSEARDYAFGTSSGPATGPYRQTYQNDVFGNMTGRTNRFWSQDDSLTATYTNHRRQGFQYDADGRLKQDNDLQYHYDAAGVIRNTFNAPTNKWLTLIHDADGRQVKKVETVFNPISTCYYLRSTVMGGRIIAELDQSAQKKKGYVFLGGELLAQQESNTVTYTHENFLTGSVKESNQAGLITAQREFDPMGVDVGQEDPFIDCCFIPPPFEPEIPRLLGGSGIPDGRCQLDGMAIDCGFAMSLLASGAAAQCPNNDCGPRRVIYQGQETWAFFQAFADGYQGYVPGTARYIGNGGIAPAGSGGTPRLGRPGDTPGPSRRNDTNLGQLNGASHPEEDLGRTPTFFGMGFGGVFMLGVAMQEPQEVPLPDLRRGIAELVSDPKCANFIDRLLSRTSYNTRSPILEMSFAEIFNQSTFTLLPPKERGTGNYNRVGGGLAWGSILQGTANIQMYQLLRGVFPASQFQAEYVHIALHEAIHLAAEAGTYSDEVLAKAAFDLMSPKDQKENPIPKPGSDREKFSAYWDSQLRKYCKRKE